MEKERNWEAEWFDGLKEERSGKPREAREIKTELMPTFELEADGLDNCRVIHIKRGMFVTNTSGVVGA